MNCYHHPDRPAVVQCKGCGKGFCAEEADTVIDGLCYDCRKKVFVTEQNKEEQISKDKKKWYITTIIGSIVAAVVFAFIVLVSYVNQGDETDTLTSSQKTQLVLLFAYAGYAFYTCWRYSRIVYTKLIRRLLGKNEGCLVSIAFLIIVRIVISLILYIGAPFIILDNILGLTGKNFIPNDL